MRIGAVVELLENKATANLFGREYRNSMSAETGAKAIIMDHLAGIIKGRKLINIRWIKSNLCKSQKDGNYYAFRFKVIK